MDELTQAQQAELVGDLRRLLAELDSVEVTLGGHAQTVELDQASVGRLSRIAEIERQHG